jgi:hypothetical protein
MGLYYNYPPLILPVGLLPDIIGLPGTIIVRPEALYIQILNYKIEKPVFVSIFCIESVTMMCLINSLL